MQRVERELHGSFPGRTVVGISLIWAAESTLDVTVS
jgi:hypothetical protein